MSRPRCCRMVSGLPACRVFKPVGVPTSRLEEVVLTVDEFEAIRLADREGLYQETAAGQMGISRQTFGRIIESARRKVAQALVEGLALRIAGGEVAVGGVRTFACVGCGHVWESPCGQARPERCPACTGNTLRCAGRPGAACRQPA